MPAVDPGGPPRRNRLTPHDRRDGGGGRVRPVGVASAILPALRDPVVGVFLLAGIFDALAGDPVVHSAALFAVAIALGWDAVRRARAGWAAPDGAGSAPDGAGSAGADPAGSHPGVVEPTGAARTVANLRLSPVMVMGGLAYAVLVGGFARYSWPATIAVVVPAAAGVAVSWQQPARADTDADRVDAGGAVVWASVFVALALWELAALLLQPSLTTESYAHPTISFLMDPVLASHLGRSIALCLWLASGWYLVRR